jgi:hypothetical protein
MQNTLLTILLSLVLNLGAQQNPTVVFNFDTTKVFIKYLDLVPVLKKRNQDFKQASVKATKNDTILLDGHTLRMGKYYDTLAIELHDELFVLVDQKIGKMEYKGNAVTAYETKKVRTAKYGKKYFVGIYYYDADTKKHFLTRTIYQRWNFTPFPDF